jgi:hypothetical protein
VEINTTSPDAPADGTYRKTTHERYLGRRRSSQPDELTTNGGQARTPSDRIVDGVYLKRAPNRSKINFVCYFEGNCGCLETGGLTTTHRLMVNRSWCRCKDRMGAWCAPKCPSFEPPFVAVRIPVLDHFWIFTFSTAVVLLHPDNQLQCGAGGTLGLSRGANSH